MTKKFDVFQSSFAQNIFLQKYSMNGQESWADTCRRVVQSVCQQHVDKALQDDIYKAMVDRKFIPGGRYLYAAGREFHQVNNCFLFRAEDSREGWADAMQKATSALMTGGGIGFDYSLLRPTGSLIRRTGGTSTGPIALMHMVNEAGRFIMQGGARRCLPGDTMITMSDWTKKPINKIEPGEAVQTRFGPKKVLAVQNQGLQNIIEITTDRGTVRCSPDHKWLAADTARLKGWKRAKNLSLSNKLYFYPAPKIPSGNSQDTETAYMIGYFLGDGCAYSSGRTHEVTFQFADPKHNKKQVDRIARAMKHFCSSSPVTRKGHGNCTELRCRDKDLVPVFQKWKTPHLPFSIPTEIASADLATRYAFLAGWFDADGYFGKDSWKLANKHPSTRAELIDFARNLGFLCTENGIEVRFCSYQNSLFAKTVGKYTFKKWRRRLSKETAEIPAQVLSINTGSSEVTFDLQIEDVEEFIADDFISHNSAIWAGLQWDHADIPKFLVLKDWTAALTATKKADLAFPLPMEGTNISVIYNTAFFRAVEDAGHPDYERARDVWIANCRQAFSTAEPGMSFNFCKDSDSLRNACTEVTSTDDSDRCNLGTVWINRCKNKEEFAKVCQIATIFLLCGGIYSHVPTDRIRQVGSENNRIGLGLGGIHEWLMQRGYDYEVTPELHKWLRLYEQESDSAAYIYAKALGVAIPKGRRAIAPTGTIGIIAETTTGIEPLFCKAYKRRYLKGDVWHYEYVIDGAVRRLQEQGIPLEKIKDSYDISFKARVKFQADVQQYVDMAISSTCNLPEWGAAGNTEADLDKNSKILLRYAKRLRGFTCYPDGARGGQPLTRVTLEEALAQEGKVFEEIETSCINGVCGI